MPTITLLDKFYGSNSATIFQDLYSSLVEGLEVQLQFRGKTDRGWIQVDISGNDTPIALNLFEQEIGLAPCFFDELHKFSVVKGRIFSSNKKSDELHVDLGIVSPKPCDAIISETDLWAQLADGKQIPFQELVKLFCLYNNVPVEVKLTENVNPNRSTVKAVLSDKQVSLFHDWVGSRFDRLVILGSHFSKVEQVIQWSRHARDIIKIESLGVLEQVVLCKLGTDAVGLIPKIGRYIKSAVLVPFSPKKIIQKIGNQPFDE
ncbi:MAG: DUF2110 family protein [Candidatus Bathyarchaeota archaeon]|nr:DUF2110 family protein [Candidatus Bathyarchaeum tardum]WGM89305.1 MAG: DUF2110 family protein [Candidatus Bathyarchaeum tardum]WNZ28414.1 MAG: DUF2110 family protein [Candidatus Bathyarchaeota archaeon]